MKIAQGALLRAVELESQGVVLKCETLIEITQLPKIGIEIMNDFCEDFYQKTWRKTKRLRDLHLFFKK